MHRVNLPERSEGEDRPKAIRINRTTDTRIFRMSVEALRPYFSIGYRGVRCSNCITEHNDAQLIHAISPQTFLVDRTVIHSVGPQPCQRPGLSHSATLLTFMEKQHASAILSERGDVMSEVSTLSRRDVLKRAGAGLSAIALGPSMLAISQPLRAAEGCAAGFGPYECT